MAITPMLATCAHLRPCLANVWLGDRRPHPGTPHLNGPDAQALIARDGGDPVSAALEVRDMRRA